MAFSRQIPPDGKQHVASSEFIIERSHIKSRNTIEAVVEAPFSPMANNDGIG